MKPTSDSVFVADLLAEKLDGPFRERLLMRAIRTARRRRQRHIALQAAVVLTALSLIPLTLRRATTQLAPELVQTAPHERPSSVVVVRTKAMPAADIVRSMKVESIVVHTASRSDDLRASDADLFASLGNRPAALIRAPGQPARLILAQADRKSRLP